MPGLRHGAVRRRQLHHQRHDAGALPFRYARILLDSTSVIIGFLLGSLVGIGTVVMALGMGPLINFFNQHVNTPLLRRNGLQ